MKKKTVLILVIGFALLMTLSPSDSHARRYHGHPGVYAAGALIGGVVLGTVIGSAISQPRYVAVPQPVYAYPEPTRVYSTYSTPPYAAPPGRWVVVPGRWVNGAWVPAHRVWTPVNPY